MPPGKIGKSEAEDDYYNKLVPAVKSRPDLFPPETLNRWYSLDRYHVMGSRILSRSFQVERWDPSASGEEDDGVPPAETDADGGTQHPVGPDAEQHCGEMEENGDDDPDGEDHEDPGDVAMVPMADMLNARFGCNNVRTHDSQSVLLTIPPQARLFYEDLQLKMVATKPIDAGDQIVSSRLLLRQSLLVKNHLITVEYLWRTPQFRTPPTIRSC